jgi:translation initiation factor 4A
MYKTVLSVSEVSTELAGGAAPEETDVAVDVYEDFVDMGLRTSLILGIFAMGFEKPSWIQQHGIALLCEGRDCIFETQNGTGRSVAFSIAVLQSIDFSVRKPQAIVLAPDSNVALGTHRVMTDLALHMNIKIHLVVGGQGQPGMEAHANMLAEGVHIVVGTPGRLHHLITETSALQTERVKTLVIRNADEVFDRFGNMQIDGIMGSLPGQPQVCLSTSTSPASLLDFVHKSMHDPLFIRCKRCDALENVKQYFVDVDTDEWKIDTLIDILESLAPLQAIVFCNSDRKVQWVLERMSGRDFACNSVTNEMDSRERALAVEEFRSGNSRVLITMDVFARSRLGYELTNLIINYDVPGESWAYINRIATVGLRTDCKGGAVINLVATQDVERMRSIEADLHTGWTELPHDVDIWT